jgi:hypothetical protein
MNINYFMKIHEYKFIFQYQVTANMYQENANICYYIRIVLQSTPTYMTLKGPSIFVI